MSKYIHHENFLPGNKILHISMDAFTFILKEISVTQKMFAMYVTACKNCVHT